MKNILFIDIEGGWGGSSRSLYYLISNLDRSKFNPVVIYRKPGPNRERYEGLGITTYLVEGIFSFAPRKRKSIRILYGNLADLLVVFRRIKMICSIASDEKIDLIHLNYEGLFFVAKLLSKKLSVPIVCHSRTLIPKNYWGKHVVRTLEKSVEHMFFISDNEHLRFKALAKEPTSGDIIWNIAKVSSYPPSCVGEIKNLVYLGNIDYSKGTDRLIDLAIELKNINYTGTKILVYGKARNNSDFYLELERKINKYALTGYIQLKGHTPNPELVLKQAYIVIRPSRGDDPWGRDVIEATSQGVPVIATGHYEGIIENMKSGILIGEYSKKKLFDSVNMLLSDMRLWEKMSRYAIEKSQKKYLGTEQATLVGNAYDSLL